MKSLRELIKKNQKIFIGLAAVLIVYSIWNTFFKDSDVSAFSSEAGASVTNNEFGRQIVATLARLNTVNIDTEVIQTDLFQRLQDFSQPLPTDLPISKENPFIFELISSNPLTTESQQSQEVLNTEIDSQRPGAENDAPIDQPVNTQ